MARAPRTQPAYQHVAWPSWRYGPNGHAKICESEADVPAGWVDHPSKVTEKASATSDAKPARKPAAKRTRKPAPKKAPATDAKPMDL